MFHQKINTMKKYIKVKAFTGADWDSVDYALIELKAAFLLQLKKYINLAKFLKSIGVDSINVIADNAEFFVNRDNDVLVDENFCKVISLTDKKFNELDTPNSEIKYGKMCISNFKIIFSGNNKHTDDEFWCEVSNEFILKLCKKIK